MLCCHMKNRFNRRSKPYVRAIFLYRQIKKMRQQQRINRKRTSEEQIKSNNNNHEIRCTLRTR